MVLSTNPPFLFIHIPKTAGTSIEEALFDYQDFDYMNEPHPIVAQYKTYLPKEMYNKLFKFSFVRNPWALQLSTYTYYAKNNEINITFDEYIKWKYLGNPMDIRDRVMGANSEEEVKSKLMVAYHMNRLPQTYFLMDELGEIQMDYIGSLENIKEDFKIICKKLNIDETSTFLSHSNRSNYDDKKTFLDYYTEETKKIVADRFNMDIKIYGYGFDLNPPKNSGYITKKKISEYGIIIPQHFYFNLGSLPYGYHDVLHRYDTEEVMRLKSEHDRNKVYRRMESLNNNLNEIHNQISEKESQLFSDVNQLDSLILQEDILKLREYELVYRTQLYSLEISLNNYRHD
jgi:chondroitin 4-sulfotransferase 11